MSRINYVTTEAFEADVLKSELPVLVDFTASWCGPCKAVAPALEDLALDYEGEVRIVKVDIDADPKLAETYSVQGVPTFLMMKNGEVKERFSGSQSRGMISSVIERVIGAAQ
jgi:thioredoxin 1